MMNAPKRIALFTLPLFLIALSACATAPPGGPSEGDSDEGPPGILDFPDKPKELSEVYVEHDPFFHQLAAFGALGLEKSMDMGGFWAFMSGTIPLRYVTGPDGKLGNPRWVIGYSIGEFAFEIPASGPGGEGIIGGESGIGYELRGYLYPAPKCKLTVFITEYQGPEVTGHISSTDGTDMLRVQEAMYDEISPGPEQIDFDLTGVPVVTYELPNYKEVFYIRYFDDPTSGCEKLAVRYSLDADDSTPDVERGADIIEDGFWETFTTAPLDEWEAEFDEYQKEE
jgi:hypothetical protein